jgi:hypothetical protein
MNDEQLLKLSNQVDTFLMQAAIEHETPALALSAVILARLLLLNAEANSASDFKKLLGAVSEAPIIKTTSQPLH